MLPACCIDSGYPQPSESPFLGSTVSKRVVAGFVNGLRNNTGMAYQLAWFQNDYGDWRELFKQLDRINAVTPEDIQRVAKEYFTEENRTIAKLNTIEG